MSLCKVSAVKMALNLVPKGYSNFTHPQTGTLDAIKASNDAIHSAFQCRDAGSLAFKQAMRDTDGDRKIAGQASWDAMNGKCLTNLWDELCKQGHLICMVITCPR